MARSHVTTRCDDDLAELPAEDADALLDKFIGQRAQAPESGDLINDLRERPCYSLHSGRYRAATWYDAERDVVWLLAVGIHRSGSRDDFYNWAVHLEQTGRLYPTREDYNILARDEQRARLEREAMALQRLCKELVKRPDSGTRTYTSDDGLYAEMWAEAIEELALVVVRVRLTRLTGQWLTDTELAILIDRALGPDARSRPDLNWLFRSFEEYFPLNAGS